MEASGTTTAPGGRPIRIQFTVTALIILAAGIALTARPSGQVEIAVAGLALLWFGAAGALAPAARFASPRGGRYNPQRATPRTLIVTAEIGAGGPTGVYAARLQ